jgi:hypothetical protein
LGFEREKIVLNRASSCRPSSFVFCLKKKAVVMNKLESTLVNIANGALEVNVGFVQLDLGSIRRLFAACCDESSRVKKLNLAWCGVDLQRVKVISLSLRSNSVLTELNLSGNEDIGPRGAQALGEMLCVSATLKTLWLYSCKIGDEGAGHLAVALRQNRTLEELSLCKNDLMVVGAAGLAEALPFNQTLKVLLLSENPLGEDGVEALTKGVPYSGLRKLALHDFDFGERGCAALVEMLKNGSRLRKLQTDSVHRPALNTGFCCNGWLLDFAPEQYLERNRDMHEQARKSVYTLLLIRKLRRTALSTFPKEVVREVAQFVYSSRGEISVWQANKQ